MRNLTLGLALAVVSATTLTTAAAQSVMLVPALAPIGFLLGSWTSGTGTVSDTGGTSRGSSTITTEVGGAVLLRRDHTELFGADGKPTGAFDQLMMIYPEDGTLRADYSDGQHVIHYRSAVVTPGRSVMFETDVSRAAPAYRLSYELTDQATLAVKFEIEPPGQSAFHPIATGTLRKGT